jgi:hypothetical protein
MFQKLAMLLSLGKKEGMRKAYSVGYPHPSFLSDDKSRASFQNVVFLR